jgi:transcriptional regulator with XRE-family HTH domain
MARTTRSVGRPPARAAARGVGERVRAARTAAGWTQADLAGDRFSKAYISALENGLVQPSMAALAYLANRLGTTPAALIATNDRAWTRLEADVRLAAGDWQAAADVYDELLTGVVEPLARAELQRGVAEALCRLDRGREAIAPATEAFEAFASAGRTADAALATYWLSCAHYGSDSLEEARNLLRTLLDRRDPRQAVDPDLHVRALVAAASVDVRTGAHDQALSLLEEAQVLADGFDDLRRASISFGLAASYRELGDLEGALRQGQRSLGLYRAANAERDAAAIGNDIALTYLAMGNFTEAGRYADEAEHALVRLADRRKLAHVLDTQAQLALARGELVGARELASQAIATAQATGNRKALVDALTTRARTAAASDDVNGASQDFEAAAGLADQISSRARRAEVLRAWAEVLAASGQHRRAYELMQTAAKGA